MLFKSIILLLFTSSALNAYPSINWNTDTRIYNLSRIINKIHLERNIFRFIITSAYNSSQSCLSDEDIRWLSANNTVKLLRSHSDCLNSSNGENDNMLLIRCLPDHFEPELFEQMVSCLEDRRHSRILFIWNVEYTTASMKMRREFQHQQQLLFKYCAEMRLLNVVGIYRDYASDGHFYTYSYFPEFHLQRKTSNEDCFPNRIRDLKGIGIRTIADQIQPWTIVWRNQQGDVEIGGFVAKVVKEFVTRNNATLVYPIEIQPNDILLPTKWSELLRKDELDIVTGIAVGTVKNPYRELSTTLQPIDWTVMMPLPPLVPDRELLWFILNSVLGLFLLILLFVFSFVFTLESVLREQHSFADALRFFIWIFTNLVLRGVIGQSSSVQVHDSARCVKRFLYIFLLLSGIFVSTYISAGLQSYSTSSPPQYPRIGTFDELLHSKVRVKISIFEAGLLRLYLSPKSVEMLEKILVIESSVDKLQIDRLSMDTRFGYVIISPLWSVVSKYQSYLPSPLFYVNEEVHLTKNLPMAIPLQRHSIFKEALDAMILKMQSVGLAELWTRQLYDDMVAAKKLNTTIDKRTKRDALTLEDFYWLWWMYGIGLALSILVFFFELCHKRRITKSRENFGLKSYKIEECVVENTEELMESRG